MADFNVCPNAELGLYAAVGADLDPTCTFIFSSQVHHILAMIKRLSFAERQSPAQHVAVIIRKALE